MIVGREANRISVPIPPREGLDVARVVKLCSEDGAVADPLSNLARDRIEEGRYRGPGLLLAERGIAASSYPRTRDEDILTQRDILARVETNDPAVGRRPLRPADPPAFERELLGRMVTRRQVCDEWRDLPGHRIYGDDARTVIWWCTAVSRLIGVSRKEPPAREAVDECDVDRRSSGLEPAPARRGLAQGAADQSPVSVEDQDVGCERVGRAECTANNGVILLVAPTTPQAMSGFQNEHLKVL